MRHSEKASRERLLFHPNPLRLSLFIFQPVSSPFFSPRPGFFFPLLRILHPVLASFPSSGSVSKPPRPPGRGVPGHQIPSVCRGSTASVSTLCTRAIGRSLAAFPSKHHSERATNERGCRSGGAIPRLFFFMFSLNRETVCYG